MSEQELWEEFFATGSVESYLNICRERQNGEEKSVEAGC